MLLFCLTVGVADVAPAPSVDEPDAELLDFLGSWQAEDGHWVDPFTLTEPDDHAAPPPPEQEPNLSGKPAATRKPARETPPTSHKNRPRDPLRMDTGP